MFSCLTRFSKNNNYQAYVRLLRNIESKGAISVEFWWKIVNPKMLANSNALLHMKATEKKYS